MFCAAERALNVASCALQDASNGLDCEGDSILSTFQINTPDSNDLGISAGGIEYSS